MSFKDRVKGSYQDVDRKLIRGGSFAGTSVYLLHHVIDRSGDLICFDKIAVAFGLLVFYFIAEPLVHSFRKR
jgi:hypothetical protein